MTVTPPPGHAPQQDWDPDHPPAVPLPPYAWLAALRRNILPVLAGFAIAILINALYTTYAVASSAHRECTTLTALARLQPPAGSKKTNPSRAFDQDQHALLAQLARDQGCAQLACPSSS